MDALFTQHSLIFHLAALFGVLAHVVKKWLRGELSVPVIDYLFRVNPKASALMAITAIGGVSGAILGGQLTDSQVGLQLMAAWGIGYVADSGVNR